MGPGHQKTLCRTQALAWGTHRVRFSCEVSGEDGSGGTGPGRGCLSSSAPRDAAGQSSGNRSSLRGAGLAVTDRKSVVEGESGEAGRGGGTGSKTTYEWSE